MENNSDKISLLGHNERYMIVEKFLNHISNWGKLWFGLIFLGSIFNEILENLISLMILLFSGC